MLDSREAFVHYTMPLGLHHLIGGDHYAPMPENTGSAPRGLVGDAPITAPTRPASATIGRAAAARAVDQYRAPLREWWSDPRPRPTTLLLWFHHLPWDYRMKSGRTLWDELVSSYGARRGRGEEDSRRDGRRCAAKIDEERYQAVLAEAAPAVGQRPRRGATSASRYFQAARARP